MGTVTINLKLTERGREVHRQNHDAYVRDIKERAPKAKPFDYVAPREPFECHLWELFEIFGPHMHMGVRPFWELGDITLVIK